MNLFFILIILFFNRKLTHCLSCYGIFNNFIQKLIKI